jgi:Na+/melibiose symporter-like transporter
MVDPLSTVAIMLNAALIGIGATFCFSMMITNRADTVDLIEWADGRRIDSLVGTTMTFAGKCASALCSFLIGILLQLARYDASLTVQSDSAIAAINSLLGWIPFALGLVLLLVSAIMRIETEVKAMNEGKKAGGLR